MHDPLVVSRDEWLAARRELLAEEKEFTRQRDALNTRRRELPMVEIDKDYIFRGPDGQASLPDLFSGRGQLLAYHFMFDPDYDFHVTLDPAVAPVEYNYRDLDELGPDWHGWTGELHGISAFLRRGDRVFHTYSSYARGTDIVNSTYQWLDLTARGRQEDWEHPSGRSDGPLMSWLRHHDRYGA
jgi:predicted dithiol-disulfide oxidoreductase (DUF899 family)